MPKPIMKSVFLNFYSHRVRVSSNSHELLGRIKDLYGYFSCEGENGCEIAFHLQLSQKNKIPSLFYMDGELLYQDRQVDTLFVLLDWGISYRVIRLLRRFSQFHSAALSLNGQGIIFPGSSQAGKSTLSAALLLEDFKFLSDEIALIDLSSRDLFPFPRSISFDPKAISFISKSRNLVNGLRHYRDFDGTPRVYINPLGLKGESIGEKALLKWIVFPARTSGKNLIRPISKRNAAMRLIRNAIWIWPKNGYGFDGIVDLVQRVNCYELKVNSFHGIGGLLKEKLNGI